MHVYREDELRVHNHHHTFTLTLLYCAKYSISTSVTLIGQHNPGHNNEVLKTSCAKYMHMNYGYC